MDNKEWWKLFNVFLEMNGALGTYKYHARKMAFEGTYYDIPLSKVKQCAVDDWVSRPFSWEYSRQGTEYWRDLHNRWNVTVDTVNRRLRAES